MFKYFLVALLALLPVFNAQAEDEIMIPVLKAAMGPGQIIGEQDLDWIEMSEKRANKYIASDIRHLIGKTPKRFIKAKKPIRKNAVKDPVLVERKNLITIVLRSPQMLLTAQGQAMEDGAKGDVIRVMNINSRKIIAGRVISPNRVDVVLANQLALHE